MKRFLLFILLILFASVCFAGDLTAIEKDSFDVKQISHVDGFAKVEIDGITAFTSINFEKENIFIATDKLFYGSKDGQIDLTVYLGSLNPKNYKVAIELENGKRIDVKEYTINQSKTIPKSSLTDSFEIPSIQLTKEINSITLKANFDPDEIGLKTKFNVVVYDLLGTKVFELDPDLSGCGYKQTVTLNTNGIGLGANITNPHAIFFEIPSSNTDFWANEGYGTGNGVRFSPDGVTDLNFHFTNFSDAENDANGFVRLPDFDSSTDDEITLYYNCVDSDFQNKTGTFPAGYIRFYSMDETSGNISDSTSNAGTGTARGNPTYKQTGKINKAIQGDGDGDYFLDSQVFTNGNDFSFLTWAYITAYDISGANMVGQYNFGADRWFYRINSVDSKPTFWKGDQGSVVTSSTAINLNTWFNVGFTLNGTTGALILYLDGANVGSGTDTTKTWDADFTGYMGYDASNDDIIGKQDEIRIFNYVLTPDEIKLLYNAELDSSNFLTFGSEEIAPVGPVVQSVGYTRYFADYDDRKDLDDSNKFVNLKLVTNESTTLKNDEIAKNLLIGIIILLGILILLIIILMKGKK